MFDIVGDIYFEVNVLVLFFKFVVILNCDCSDEDING